jgi:hypothetical protein
MNVSRIIVLIEREMPASQERAALDAPMGPVNIFGFTNDYLIIHPLTAFSMSSKLIFACPS